MSKIEISHLLIYPIKSTIGIELEESIIENIGLKFDRSFAVINKDNQVITARENPKLLNLITKIDDSKLSLSTFDKEDVELSLTEKYDNKNSTVGLFKDEVNAKIIHHKINNWISEMIEEPSKLIAIDNNELIKVKPKYNGKVNDYITFNDAAPLHLISEASVNDLNLHLEKPVTIHRFRPNIVIKGCKAYEEETWKQIKIGTCLFDVAVRTKRCSFLTIHHKTLERDTKQEPLRTLAKVRKGTNKANFGLYLIPRKLGVVRRFDELEVIG